MKKSVEILGLPIISITEGRELGVSKTLLIDAKNDAMCQEFTKNIHYLGTVQDILAKHAALSTPFPQIPGDIMQEIETEFQAHSGSAK